MIHTLNAAFMALAIGVAVIGLICVFGEAVCSIVDFCNDIRMSILRAGNRAVLRGYVVLTLILIGLAPWLR